MTRLALRAEPAASAVRLICKSRWHWALASGNRRAFAAGPDANAFGSPTPIVKCVVALTFLISWVSCPVATAQFQLDIEQVAAEAFPNVDDAEDETETEVRQRIIQRGFNAVQNIDAWVFNRHGNEAGAKQHLRNQLALTIESIDRNCLLSSSQKEKLRLAGQGDMTLFFSDVEEIRAKFGGQNNQNNVQQIWQLAQPLQQKMLSNLFDRGSILYRACANTLDEEQLRLYRQSQKTRTQFAYRAAVKNAVAGIEKSCPLKSTQRKQLLDLLYATEPPKTLGAHMRYYVVYKLSELKDEFSEFMDEGQLRTMRQVANQGRAYGQFLRQQGHID